MFVLYITKLKHSAEYTVYESFRYTRSVNRPANVLRRSETISSSPSFTASLGTSMFHLQPLESGVMNGSVKSCSQASGANVLREFSTRTILLGRGKNLLCTYSHAFFSIKSNIQKQTCPKVALPASSFHSIPCLDFYRRTSRTYQPGCRTIQL